MSAAKLKFDGKQTEIYEGVTTIGRASDNNIAFTDNSNISRYHAEIDAHGGDYWLIELGSSNGTKVNGTTLKTEMPLKEGDKIVLGNSVEIEFTFKDEKAENGETAADSAPVDTVSDETEAEEAADESSEEAAAAEEVSKKSNLPLFLGIAGALCGLALVFIVAAVVFTQYNSSSSSASGNCQAQAEILKPEIGDTINEETEIEMDTQDDGCVARAVFLIDGKEFADASDRPFSAKLDPGQMADYADGFEHSLSVILFDDEGNQIKQNIDVPLAFQTIETSAPKEDEIEIAENDDPKNPASTPKSSKGAEISLIETQKMTENVVKQFSGNFQYKFDKQFLQEIGKKTSEFVSEGYFARAQQYRDTINVAFVQEQNLDPPLGYILAMSRSQFKLDKPEAGEGLWQMTEDFTTANAYNGLCGEENLSNPAQNCAAKASSLYMKDLTLKVFDGEAIYSVAAFGKSLQGAYAWKNTIPADRSDVWNAVKTPRERENLVRFFAAALVAENPQKFGLKNDRPISELYRNLIR